MAVPDTEADALLLHTTKFKRELSVVIDWKVTHFATSTQKVWHKATRNWDDGAIVYTPCRQIISCALHLLESLVVLMLRFFYVNYVCFYISPDLWQNISVNAKL
ncbi:hypothetical protein AHF37_00187 [Paragonimus kellicotti]|nr:hypothetical protein AHF37_00187 [Paragonimus kellicotti]